MRDFYFIPFLNEAFFDLFAISKNRSISSLVLLRQILFTGYEALSLILFISLLLGALIIVEGHNLANLFGQTEWIYNVLISVLMRDLGPFIVSFILIARSGTAISTELGNMVINREIDALRVMGISPISYLVTPRIFGVLVSHLILAIYFFICGSFGGFLVSNMFHSIPFADFLNQLLAGVTPADILVMLFKVMLSGYLIGAIACFHGLSVARTITAVPQRTIKSVGQSIFAVCLVNLLATLGYFLSLVSG